jgi:hypothetical protein
LNLDFSDDQKALKDQARKFLQARCPITTTREVLDDAAKPFSRELWQAIAEMGWTGVAIPEKWGGASLGHVDLCAIAEELGRAVAPVPFGSTVYVFAEAIMAAGSEEQQAALLPRLAAGEVIGCLAVSEGRGFLAPDTVAASVVGGRLTGAKTPVTDGDVATHALVLARSADGVGLFVIDCASDGVTRERLETLDPTRSAARLQFDNVACAPLGRPADGAATLSHILDRAAVLFAFEQVGGADRCLEEAKAYAMQRYAFGRVIGSYQAIKHKLADIYLKNELARSSAYYGAWALASDAPELPQASAAARIAATRAYDFAAKENVQTHGGMGFTWEADCLLHLRRARQLALVVGGLPVWRERLVRRLEQRNAA